MSLVTVPQRVGVLRILTSSFGFGVARELEGEVFSLFPSERDYQDECRRLYSNLKMNPSLLDSDPSMEKETQLSSLVGSTDSFLAKGTIVERISMQDEERRSNFQKMLEDKFQSVKRDASGGLKCRRCGSDDVSWDQKQTRSADEGSTVFCECSVCHARWKMM